MLKSLINQWFDFIDARFTPGTVELYISALDRYNQSITHLPQNPKDIEQYLTNFAASHKPRTTNSHLAAIRSFYKWAETLNIENPTKKIDFLFEPPSDTRVLSEEEYRLCLQFAPPMLNKAIQFLGNTGLRSTEFSNIRWPHFSADLSFVHVDGKGRKRREAPLNDTCRRLLAQPRNTDRPDFVAAFHRRQLYWSCCDLADRLKIPHFGGHAIRHFFATRCIRAGIPYAKLSLILGHANTIITEQIYVHLCPQDLQVTDCLRF